MGVDIYTWKQASSTYEFSSTLNAHKANVTSIDINNDHTIIVSGSEDETAIVWAYNSDTGSYNVKQTLEGMAAAVPIVKVSGDGNIIAVGC